MVDPLILLWSVLKLFMLLIPGFILRKTNMVASDFPRPLSNLILYVAQPAMIIVSFIRPFDREVAITAAGVLVFSFVAHTIFYLLAQLLFKKAAPDARKVYRFGSIFGNAGYMGIPLIMSLFGNDAGIYASVYIIGFNFFTWSLGCLIYSGDKSFISPKKMFLNAATIPTYIGILVFLLPIDAFVPDIVTEVLSALRDTVAPLSMILIGMQLADVKLKGAFNDPHLWEALGVRLFLFPAIIWGVTKIVSLTGLYTNELASSVTLICAATPCAAATGMFAARFHGDEQTASKYVSISTILSVITMPIVALLLKI